MHLSLTSCQMACIIYIAMLVSSCVLEASATDAKISTCCPNVSSFKVKDPVQNCARVPARRRGRAYCYEAYVLFANNKNHCINVNAPWINETLEQLKQDGNPCKGTPQ